MRPQHKRERCGACGKKMAWVYIGRGLSCELTYDVSCMSCKAKKIFTQWGVDGVADKWPGSLEAAALALKPKEEQP